MNEEIQTNQEYVIRTTNDRIEKEKKIKEEYMKKLTCRHEIKENLTEINKASAIMFFRTQIVCVILTLILGNHKHRYLTNDAHYMIEGWLLFFCWFSVVMLFSMTLVSVIRKVLKIDKSLKVFSL